MSDSTRGTEPAAEGGPLRQGEALSLPLRLRELSPKVATRFQLSPSAQSRAELAEELGALKIRKLAFQGHVRAEGKHDWRLEGMLGATVVQPCVVTAEPVTTRIDTPVTRLFLRDMPEPTESEVEMPEDDSLEPLGAIIDPGAVMVEALALAMPEYPRAEGAELPATARDDTPDERPNPFAALAGLKKDAPGTGGQ